ncbi:Transposase [Nitrosomonas aestuarii]|uniref:Transposase n=1 Tax=Nitrosomonas aestuarii TaxID=52441 RepID=A0A1I4EZC8_9PROT|nr:Transposase [Nitrosomonas aestuarii]
MSPQFVKPYVKTNKHDVADAEAVCEAVSRPDMRFVLIKNAEQQAILSIHRARQGFVKARTAQANQIRGLLSEFGIVIPQGIRSINKRMVAILEDAENKVEPESWLRKLIARRNKNVAAVALANKNVRIIWALLSRDTKFHPNYTSSASAAKA